MLPLPTVYGAMQAVRISNGSKNQEGVQRFQEDCVRSSGVEMMLCLSHLIE
jgi:hypothetical protein